ncbi:PucR family transcriptional regulator [Xylanibacillus composti]|uniref:Purine catabolism regulatory protein n=1 Tax=Xylanibacillus composti TaxID=1572762 RepID=A0A8J4H421_9BACL|nr:PucR family transcriptional regulator [Xylanibacillus composti]MDT9726143.1 PucR family transcriptional regulator [Xylanibacillus composti]GIQ70622.1 purine catabolism regulatory protein [Xylanibacillus composti]
MGKGKQTGFTCGDVLLIPDFQEAVVLAGKKGLHRAITRVNVMEVPDVIDWVRPGEFLITSGFPFRDRPDAIADMIPQLAAKGVSALGLKTKRFIDRIPQQALDAADQLDFPIFELPASTVFSDVVRDIMERVLVQEARELSLLQSRFQKLSQQLLSGKGIEEFLGELDRMLGNPVILLDEEEHVLLSPQAEEAVRQMGERLVWDQLRGDSNLGVSFMTVGERRIRVYPSRIDNKQGSNSLLLLLEWNEEYTMVDQLTIDRVGILVGLEMINANARKEVEAKYVDQFLQDWLSGRIVTLEDLKLRAEACGCPLGAERSMHVGVLRWLAEKPAVKELQLAVKRLRRRFAERAIHVTLLEGTLVFLLSPTPQGSVEQAAKGILAELDAAFAAAGRYSLCLGNPVGRPDQVHASYQQARKIYHIASICDLREGWIDYAQLGVYQLLYLLPDTEEVTAFRDRFIVPLLEYEQKNGTMLMETLRVYFKHNRNAKRTSEELFTHYNTVTYRIERICGILGIDADNGDHLLQLHLAVKLYEMRPARIEEDSYTSMLQTE